MTQKTENIIAGIAVVAGVAGAALIGKALAEGKEPAPEVLGSVLIDGISEKIEGFRDDLAVANEKVNTLLEETATVLETATVNLGGGETVTVPTDVDLKVVIKAGREVFVSTVPDVFKAIEKLEEAVTVLKEDKSMANIRDATQEIVEIAKDTAERVTEKVTAVAEAVTDIGAAKTEIEALREKAWTNTNTVAQKIINMYQDPRRRM